MFRFFSGGKNDEKQGGDRLKSEAEISEYLRSYREKVEKLINERAFNKEAGELLPPWIMRIQPIDVPGIDDLGFRSPLWQTQYWYWKGGAGGKYKEEFYDFFRPLTLQRRISYFRKYDLGPEWEERRDWAMALFDEEAEKMPEHDWERMIDAILNDAS